METGNGDARRNVKGQSLPQASTLDWKKMTQRKNQRREGYPKKPLGELHREQFLPRDREVLHLAAQFEIILAGEEKSDQRPKSDDQAPGHPTAPEYFHFV